MGQSQAAATLSDAPLEREVVFRGTTYKLRELEIGEFDEITEQAKVKRMIDGNEVEVPDGILQSRLMLKACLVEPRGIRMTKIPTRLFNQLNRLVNEMHFGEEPDETAKKKADGEPEEKPSGNP